VSKRPPSFVPSLRSGQAPRPSSLSSPTPAVSVAARPRGFRDGHPFYLLSQRAVAAALRCVADIHVEGMARCPTAGSGPVLLCSNHLSYADIPLIGAWAPRPIVFFAKSEVRRLPVVGPITAFYGTIFVRRGESDRHAIRQAMACLAAGQVLGFYPEGHRSHGAGLLRAQPGVALLARGSRAVVWPVAVTGTHYVGKRARPRVTLTGGEPFDPLAAARADYGPAPSHQDIADAIMRRIAALLPAPYRGAYR
jgi:1-acyl-sn-glycerol-3-phosphate acyltransferase